MYTPSRRNRNIGTTKQGHGQNNRLRIPESWTDTKIFYERLTTPKVVKRTISGQAYTFLVEPTLSDYSHCCTIDDIERMISLLGDHAHHIDLFVLRQPTRKQVIMSHVWGRLAYYYKAARHEGTAIILEAQQTDNIVTWPKSFTPETEKELLRLEHEGHRIRIGKRRITTESTLASCRATQLYRTIPHEVGHYVDFLISDPQEYDAKPQRQKEDYAHRFADQFLEKMLDEAYIPFDRFLNERSLVQDGLDTEWFA